MQFCILSITRCFSTPGATPAAAFRPAAPPRPSSLLPTCPICAAGFLGGQASSIPYLLGRDQATKGIAVLIAAENTSNLITPAIGGALFATLGPLPALTINAITYLASQL